MVLQIKMVPKYVQSQIRIYQSFLFIFSIWIVLCIKKQFEIGVQAVSLVMLYVFFLLLKNTAVLHFAYIKKIKKKL